MSWTQRGILAVVVVLGVLIVMDRTRGTGKPGAPDGESPIKGATYASAIPVYPGAKLADIMGGEYRDAIDGPAVYTSQSWFFDITDSVATVAEFYRKNLPQGWRPKEADAGEVGFELTPAGAVDEESVYVIVRTGQLQIGEKVKAKGGA
ncbi:MAG TPA: hypothetical protein VLB00_16845 [Gemmatimonadales bacterium]|nr:hypothetical protein [Gemmatimonadales bacterium]